MGDQTNISWCDSTFNPWWGCAKIAPGCDNCYAAALDKRAGGNFWDPHTPPRRTRPLNWRQVRQWNATAEIESRRRRVFCGSMMDWCDKDAPEGAREELFRLIKVTPMLDWQLLTKRATLIERSLPADWGDGYKNVWLGVTAENKEYGYPRIDILRGIPARLRFISAEPLLGEMDDIYLGGIDWVIMGGESGPGYRPMEPSWANNLIVACESQGVPVWFKQWGGNTRGKGGCEINGREHKQWPRHCAPRLDPSQP